MRKPKTARLVTLMLCGSLFTYVTGAVALENNIVESAQATTSYYTACCNDNLKLKLPKTWKKVLKMSGTQGHGSGAYHTQILLGGVNSYEPFRIDGMDAKKQLQHRSEQNESEV